MDLFRYRPANINTLQEIVENTLWYSRFDQLNDPFEGLAFIKQSDGEIRSGFLQEIGSLVNLGVCCFSTNMSNPLLWAHYADSHKGVCLQYFVPEEMVATRFIKVHYSEKLAEFFIPTTLDKKDKQQWIESVVGPRIKEWLATKSHHCAYEEEYRSTCILGKGETGKPMKNVAKLVGVIFGYRCSGFFKGLVRKLTKDMDLCDIKEVHMFPNYVLKPK